MKLFCIPGGGTPATVFYRWKAMLKRDAEVIILDYPNRDITIRDNPLSSVRKTAEFLFEKVRASLKPDDSYALLSSCTGTMIEYELYRIIEEKGLNLPERFIAFSALVPYTDYYSECGYLSEKNRKHIKGIYISLFKSELFSYPERAAEQCTDFLLNTGSFPEWNVIQEEDTYEKKTMLEFANKTISVILYDWNLAAGYSGERTDFTKIRSDLCLIRGTEDDIVAEENAEKWSEMTEGNFLYRTVEGDHNIITNHTNQCIEMIKLLLTR